MPRPQSPRGILSPILPSYDPKVWAKLPLEQRGQQVCQAWAEQGYGTPWVVYGFYLLKVGLYIGGWLLACSFSSGLGSPLSVGDWWLRPEAFQKAIVFSMMFEGLGLGCGSGPLTGRYVPPFGGVLYWLRPGTTKLPLFLGVPIIGGNQRTGLDVAVYCALMGSAALALASPNLTSAELIPIAVLAVSMGCTDRTIFLALRAEHYWVMIVVFIFADDMVAGAKAVQLALWFFAGFSKLNRHFSTVVCVMTSNSPLTRGTPLRRWVYRDSPNDLRPSRLAEWMGYAGTALEFAVPLVLLFAPEGAWLFVGVALALVLHGYITSNVPMGVPIEWNFAMVYGVFALFWAHPEITVLDTGPPLLALFLLGTSVAVPIFGNLFPKHCSFLLAMRYYAGNWPYSVWLFRGESYRKLDKLKKSSAWFHDQLAPMYDEDTVLALASKVMGFRLMHLQGRALPILIPKAVKNLADYEYVDGELIAGLVLGWNFGDGHLHNEKLLEAIQDTCDFEEGELRCVFVEPQALGGDSLGFRIVDARTGVIESGKVLVSSLAPRQPWEGPAL